MRPEIKTMYMAVNPFTRPGTERTDTMAIDWHWNGNAGMSEYVLSEYFHGLAKQNKDDDIPDRFAGTNYVVGEDAIIEIVPPGEKTYTAGADGRRSFYTPGAKRVFGPEYTKYEPPWLSPNDLTVSVELVHPDSTGQFPPRTVYKAVLLGAYLSTLYPGAVHMRHYDITEKLCPKWWVLHQEDWESFLARVAA
tara:strand:- start:37 stop:615 length:579 start_codon:yes stop_codon:yes gene_type:complete